MRSQIAQDLSWSLHLMVMSWNDSQKHSGAILSWSEDLRSIAAATIVHRDLQLPDTSNITRNSSSLLLLKQSKGLIEHSSCLVLGEGDTFLT